jgi:hypothetical protein
MYIIKIQTTTGDWILKQAESIQYSDSPFPLYYDEKDPSQYWSPFIPKEIRRIFDKGNIDRDVEVIKFNDNVYYDYEPKGESCKGWGYLNLENNDTPNCFVNMLQNITNPDELKPEGWFGIPLYSYIILDNKKAVVFPTKAFICNDEGKTIAKI